MMSSVIFIMVGTQIWSKWLTKCLAGVWVSLVLLMRWTTWVTAPLLVVWAMCMCSVVLVPTELVKIGLFGFPAPGMSLLAIGSLLIFETFLRTLLLVGTWLFGCMSMTRLTRREVVFIRCAALPILRSVAPGIRPESVWTSVWV